MSVSPSCPDRSPFADHKPRLIVGITSASGAAYGIAALRLLREMGVETHLVCSRAAALTVSVETPHSMAEIAAMADVSYPSGDVGAAIASGSFPTLGMLIAPCSIRTMSEIASGATASLLTRAADVVLKERRRLVLMVRETPLHLGHLRSMTALTEMGGIVMPPVPALYANPASIDEMVGYTVARALDLFGLDARRFPRWAGLAAARQVTTGDPA